MQGRLGISFGFTGDAQHDVCIGTNPGSLNILQDFGNVIQTSPFLQSIKHALRTAFHTQLQHPATVFGQLLNQGEIEQFLFETNKTVPAQSRQLHG